jgi:hypothetical protein
VVVVAVADETVVRAARTGSSHVGTSIVVSLQGTGPGNAEIGHELTGYRSAAAADRKGGPDQNRACWSLEAAFAGRPATATRSARLV